MHSSEFYPNRPLYSYWNESFSPVINYILKAVALLSFIFFGWAVANSLILGTFMELLQDNLIAPLYFIFSPFLFFSKELNDWSQSLLKFDFNTETIHIKLPYKSPELLDFPEVKHIDLEHTNFLLTTKDGRRFTLSLSHLLFEQIQELKVIVKELKNF